MRDKRATVGSWVVALGLVVLATGCGGGGGSTPPSANAGTDQQAAEDTLVTLGGTATAGSSAIALVAWTQTSGPVVSLSGADTDAPSFTAPKAPIQGTVTLEFLYTVTDTGGQADSDSVAVVVTSDDFALFLAIKDIVATQELYKSDVENGTITKLSGPLVAGGTVLAFAMSPSGRFVAYTAVQDTVGVTELYVAQTNGSGVVKASGALVAGGNVNGTPYWAPDSSRVAYYATQDSDVVLELFTTRPDGTGNTQVNGPLVVGGTLSVFGSDPWAPDSSRLAYAADQDTDNLVEAYTSLPDGTGNVKVSGVMAAGGGIPLGTPLLWSPDSTRIAYIAPQDTPMVQELYAADALGGGTQKLNGPLVAGGDVGAGPTWAPDSSRIVYMADQDTDNVQEVYSSLPNGSGNIRLNPALPLGRSVSIFSIAPDSARVAYLSNQDTETVQELFASPIAGGGNVKLSGPLVAGGSVSGTARWAPDTSRIAYVADQEMDEIFELFTSGPDGSGNVKINEPLPALTNAGMNSAPNLLADWAPDASLVSYVVFSAGIMGAYQIPGYAALPDGAGSVETTGVMDPDGTGLGNWPLWAPDASHLMYVATQDSATVYELYLASPDGLFNQNISGPLVAGGGVSTSAFVWSP